MADESIPSKINEDQIDTILAPDIQFKGKIRFVSSFMIKGNFEGEIESQEGHLIIGDKARVKANIKSRIISNKGEIIGNIEAYQRFELCKKASLKGDLITEDLYIESGSLFNGNCSMEK